MTETFTVTAPDQYSQAALIEGAKFTSITLNVNNNSIYWQLKTQVSGAGGGAGYWETDETPMPPGSKTIGRPNMVGIRIRAAVPAASIPAPQKQALVTVEAVR